MDLGEFNKLKEELESIKKTINEKTMKYTLREKAKQEIYKEEYKKRLIERNKLREEKKGYYFITINPVEINIHTLISIVERIKFKIWINICAFTFEQRGETVNEMGKGQHIHMLIKRNRPKSRVITEIHNSCHKYCQKESIDVKTISSTEYEKYLNYIKGNKGKDKEQKTIIDKLYRKNNNLQDFYC